MLRHVGLCPLGCSNGTWRTKRFFGRQHAFVTALLTWAYIAGAQLGGDDPLVRALEVQHTCAKHQECSVVTKGQAGQAGAQKKRHGGSRT